MNNKDLLDLFVFLFVIIVVCLFIKFEFFTNEVKKISHNSKVCLYTCITGDYDNNVYIDSTKVNCDLLFFTNNKSLGEKFSKKGWIVNYINDKEITDNKLLARKHKSLPHKYIPDKYDISIWVDGNISLKKNFFDVTNFMKEIDIENNDIVCKKHPVRNAIKPEAKLVIRLKFEKEDNINKIFEIQKKDNFKDDVGLTETNILVRKHNKDIMNKAMDNWFELVKICIRDQISFDYILWKYKLKYNRKKYHYFHNNYFTIHGHHNTKNKIIEAFMNFFKF